MPKITLLTGGVRSGKSRFALELARSEALARKAFLATAQSLDEEMRTRILGHQAERGGEFTTFEEPHELGPRLRKIDLAYDLLLVDCLTLWVNNLFYAFEENSSEIEKRVNDFLASLDHSSSRILLVTNEVGMGIVPESALSRRFQETLGKLNQEVASRSEEVILMISGQPFTLKRVIRSMHGLERTPG